MILVVNTSFPEINQMAAELADNGLLSVYVRPYANLGRGWERRLAAIPSLGQVYSRSIGRRRMPSPLCAANMHETGMVLDFLMAAHSRLPISSLRYKSIGRILMDTRTRMVMRTAERLLGDERAVVATWGCAETVFRKAKTKGALCVLNCFIAHHRFSRRYLMEEAELVPAFASTLNYHCPPWQERRLDAEIELADRILVGSSFVRDSFVSEGVPVEKLTVIPYGADTSLFEPAEPKAPDGHGLALLFVGQIGQRKGISYLLDAVRKTASRGDSLTLVGQIQDDGRALQPYSEIFRHVPHVPRDALRNIYREADVFVFPTLVEGMPLVVLEAMASGLPVITTPNGPGDIVRDGVDGFLIPPRDAEAIVERLERLRSNPKLRAEMSHNARQRALEFTWARYRKATAQHLIDWLGNERLTSTVGADSSVEGSLNLALKKR